MKRNNKKGFTLAELLIVVAIIAVLTAIAIPVFSSQLEKARKATDEANIRSAYGDAMATYLSTRGEPDAKDSGTVKLSDVTYNWTMNGDKMTISSSGTTGLKSDTYETGITYDGTDFKPATASTGS